jgi:hypothetical protein
VTGFDTLRSAKVPWRPVVLSYVKDRTLLDSRLTDGGKVVGPTHRPHFTLQKYFIFLFLVLISVRG